MATKDIFPSWRGDLEWRDRAAALTERYPADPSYPALEARIAAEPGHLYHLNPAIAASLDPMSDAERQAYLYGFLLWQMAQFDARFADGRYPAEFALHYGDSFHRIMDGIAKGKFPFDPRLDAFHKDLGVTRLEMIPAVAQLLHAGSGVPARSLIRWPAGWYHVFVRCGGRAPFYEGHTHDPMVPAYFNPAGWEETYRLLALLLKHDPRQRGLVGFSWLNDAALGTVSPRLAYLRGSPEAKGSRYMPMGSDASSIQLSTAMSPSRKAAYEAGTYTPRRYGQVWARCDILKHYG